MAMIRRKKADGINTIHSAGTFEVMTAWLYLYVF